MYFQNFIKVAPFAMILALNTQTGCDTGGTTSPDPAGTTIAQSTGYLDLAAARVASPEFKEVNLDIRAIELKDPKTGAWITIATPNVTINIMSQADVDALLAAHVKLAVGHYTKLRLRLGDGCSLKLLDGTIHALNLQAELAAGLVLDLDLNVKLDATIRAFLDLDLSSCIQAIVAGGVNTYYLRPLFRVLDQEHVGTITGVVKAKVTGQLLAGAQVWAEWFDDAGRPHIEMTAIADVNGRFTLDRLPVGKKYHVVCRPLLGGILYGAAASVELDLRAAVNLGVDLALDVEAQVTATAAGNVTPMASLDAASKVELVELLSCGTGCNKWFVVASAMAQVGVQENYSFNILTPGRYAVQCSRQHCQTGGSCSWGSPWISSTLDVLLGVKLDLNLDINLGL